MDCKQIGQLHKNFIKLFMNYLEGKRYQQICKVGKPQGFYAIEKINFALKGAIINHFPQ